MHTYGMGRQVVGQLVDMTVRIGRLITELQVAFDKWPEYIYADPGPPYSINYSKTSPLNNV